ncbi:beta-amyrin 11-oxidase-like [Senna tora]|uniref:Beta-amyrin 11-oxidase-like n=1 Tax=Senna tora TaxID=362788 RepID=A0A834TVH1_9FABA|nr:beta-amyrin 11-oxidase-like [Senna tora]
MIVGAALLVGYGIVFGIVRRVNEWFYVGRVRTEFPVPPGDMGWPLLGNMPSFFKAFKSQPDSFIYGLHCRYGRSGMYRTHLFGSPSIIVCTPETCRKVLTNDEQFKVGYPASTITLAGKRSFHGISDAEHKRLRRLIMSPITGHDALSTYVGLIEEIAVKSLDELVANSMDAPVELLKEMRKFAFAVITNIFVGSDVDSVDLGLVENLYTHLLRGMKSQPINLPGFAFHKALKARNKLTNMLQAVLDRKRISSRKTRKDMMELLMEVKDEEGRQLEDEDIIDLLLLFLLAGHESSAIGTLWTLIYLTQNPLLFNTAKVIDEMLRRTSISFANFRQAKVDVNINGYTIPKGWKVLVWNRGVHMDPETYINPQEFDPSRWDNFKGKAGSFLPFGLGSRLCPGSELAKLEIIIFLHHFLLNYRMERINEECPLTYLPLPRPSDNCLARIIRVA